MSILFHNTIFGPVHSRRLGYSLGINLLPVNSKICSFNCIYCECGWNPEGIIKDEFSKKDDVIKELESRLIEIKKNNEPLDVLTFAGNGEPTLHYEFLEIVNEVILLRNKYFPEIKIALLSNSTTLSKKEVLQAIAKIDLPILKLDSGVEKTFRLINKPSSTYNFQNHISNLKNLNIHPIIQIMFLRGEINGEKVDNTTANELNELLNIIKEIKPQSVMIYSLDRQPPTDKLIKIGHDELEQIANIFKENNIKVQVAK